MKKKPPEIWPTFDEYVENIRDKPFDVAHMPEAQTPLIKLYCRWKRKMLRPASNPAREFARFLSSRGDPSPELLKVAQQVIDHYGYLGKHALELYQQKEKS